MTLGEEGKNGDRVESGKDGTDDVRNRITYNANVGLSRVGASQKLTNNDAEGTHTFYNASVKLRWVMTNYLTSECECKLEERDSCTPAGAEAMIHDLNIRVAAA